MKIVTETNARRAAENAISDKFPTADFDGLRKQSEDAFERTVTFRAYRNRKATPVHCVVGLDTGATLVFNN